MDKITIDPPIVQGKVQNGVACISFFTNPYEIYELYKISNNNLTLVATASGKSGMFEFCQPISHGEVCEYAVKSKIINYKTKQEIYSDLSNTIKLIYK